ncbi:MAG: hypothetical protein HY077_04035 [Elusimicrobia bacterium]|nr:hypothetical protein [Elusimicrobiota bacterium]
MRTALAAALSLCALGAGTVRAADGGSGSGQSQSTSKSEPQGNLQPNAPATTPSPGQTAYPASTVQMYREATNPPPPADDMPKEAGGVYRSSRYAPDSGSGQKEKQRTEENPARSESERPAPVRPATLSDAHDNYPSMVESFLARHSNGGLFPLAGPAKSRPLMVRLGGIKPGSVRALGRGRFTATVLFRDVAGRAVEAQAQANMSGSVWEVTRITRAPPRAIKPKKTRAH